MKYPTAFVLLPFSEVYEPAHRAVLEVLRELGFDTFRVDDDIKAGARWANEITDAIQRADLIVADVSDKNPNVMYELGYAHALRKQTILLLSTEHSGDVPVDLAGYQMLTYSPQHLDELRHQLYRNVKYALQRLDESS